MEHDSNGDARCDWRTWNSLLKFGKKTGGIENQRKTRDYPDNSFIERG